MDAATSLHTGLRVPYLIAGERAKLCSYRPNFHSYLLGVL